MRALLAIAAILSAQAAFAGELIHPKHITASGSDGSAMELIIKNNTPVGSFGRRGVTLRGTEKTATSVPEPDTMMLFAVGLAGMLALGWRRRRLG